MQTDADVLAVLESTGEKMTSDQVTDQARATPGVRYLAPELVAPALRRLEKRAHVAGDKDAGYKITAAGKKAREAQAALPS